VQANAIRRSEGRAACYCPKRKKRAERLYAVNSDVLQSALRVLEASPVQPISPLYLSGDDYTEAVSPTEACAYSTDFWYSATENKLL
jgi:hypothetical protein